MRDYVLRRLWDIVTGRETSDEFAHIAPQDRQAILEILRETLPSLPDYWEAAP